MTKQRQTTISPIDGSVYVERDYATDREIAAAIERASGAWKVWTALPVEKRARVCHAAVDAFVAMKTRHAEELSWQMGRPVAVGGGEVGGFEERARYMIDIAAETLEPIDAGEKGGFVRYIKRESLGVVLTVAPWNFPYMTAVNSVVPALMAGNAVVLKHAAQTPLCAERMVEAFRDAGLPDGVFQYLHLTHDSVARVIQSPEVEYVAFTGSVPAGGKIEQAAVGRFMGVGLELGGKDPAYVRPDVNIDYAVANLADGAFFNSGQSCCGIERIYAHSNVYEKFVDGLVELARQYRLGNPLDENTTLGPVVKTSAADFVRGQIDEAVGQGARALIAHGQFPGNEEGTPYLAPQILVDVNHSMRVMTEESFGPVVGIMKVGSDEQAIELMNDSEFGLTASVWTTDVEAAEAIGNQVETGTWFMNRCDYLDPALAWTGVKNSGRGCTLSPVGYESLTRPKSFHLRTSL
ncbi:MAG: Succinate-semialdehyde dehydrogenase [NADP(+)] 1 [Gammaproteobacteria bacterium]|nr:Succinate-semialdehyde dehydrogenase [NADP(+)] 1 [Gammaproteobacteria bacterium]